MRKIIIGAVLTALMVVPSFSQEQPKAPAEKAVPKKGIAGVGVNVPMLCGDAESVRKLLKEWKMTDIMIGANPITENTVIIYHFNREDAKMAISQWDMDMTAGCIAFIGEKTRLNRKGLRDMDPSI